MTLPDLLNAASKRIDVLRLKYSPQAYLFGMLAAIEYARFTAILIYERVSIGRRPAAGANGKVRPAVPLGTFKRRPGCR